MLIKLLQSIPPFKGKNRISKLLLKKTIQEKKDVVLKAAFDLKYKIPNFIEPVGFDILINGVHEKQTSDFIVKKIPKNGVFFDIGANIGSITLPVCRQRNDIKVLCIEASPRVFSYLQYNIKNNGIERCQIFNNAIDDVDGQVVNFYSQPELFGTGSMSAVFTDKSEQVETVTFDTLLTRNNVSAVDFIKIDIEGYEYFAFKGAKANLIKDDAPDILFEFIDWAESQARGLKPGQAQQLLMSFGYKIYEFKDGRPTGKQITEPVTKEGWIMLYATKKGL